MKSQAGCAPLIALLLTLVAPGAFGATVYVAAAASLQGPLEKIAADFAQEDHDNQIILSFAGSAQLERQILAGTGTDIFFAADPTNLQSLQQANVIEQQVEVLSNQLVLIGAKGDSRVLRAPPDLAKRQVKRIAVGDAAVPVGNYARDYLQRLKLYERLQGKIVGVDNVRAVFSMVAKGAAQAGFVYLTDYQQSPGDVRLIAAIPADQHRPIIYPLVLLRRAAKSPQAQKVFAYLHAPKALATFTKFGFIIRR